MNIQRFLNNIVLIMVCLLCFSCAKSFDKEHPVGREHKQYTDSSRISWNADRPRPLATTIWYPATSGSKEKKWQVDIFNAGKNALNAGISKEHETLPLIILSHGTGGSAMQLSWFAEALAGNGYLVAAVNHHGNTAAEESYLPQGFMLWWERSLDITNLIDNLLQDTKFGPLIDTSKIGMAGFSLGGYTTVSIAGGITDLVQREIFCSQNPKNSICVLPPESKFNLDEISKLVENNPATKSSLENAKQSFKDQRIRSIYTIAPVHGPAFTKESLEKITIPARIIVGSDDKQAIAKYNAELIANAIPKASFEILNNVTHYTFLANCTFKGKRFVKSLCSDNAGVKRQSIHNWVNQDSLDFFSKTLN